MPPSSFVSSSAASSEARWTCTRRTSWSRQVANGRGSGKGMRATSWSLSPAPAAATRTRPCIAEFGR
eukprot:5513549-Pyramimonas_sp.AAC.1